MELSVVLVSGYDGSLGTAIYLEPVPPRVVLSAAPISLLKYPRNAAWGCAAYTISREIIDLAVELGCNEDWEKQQLADFLKLAPHYESK